MMNGYKEAMDGVHFSEDIENRIIKAVQHENTVPIQKKRKYVPVGIVAAGCALAVGFLTLFPSSEGVDIFSQEDIDGALFSSQPSGWGEVARGDSTQMDGVSKNGAQMDSALKNDAQGDDLLPDVSQSDAVQTEEVQIDTVREVPVILDNGKCSIDSLTIMPYEMVVFSVDNDIEAGKKSILSGNLDGENLCYSVGYLYKGNYCEVLSKATEPGIAENIVIGAAGEYQWCVVNASAQDVVFTGDIQISVGDLVYRKYGEGTIIVDAACNLIVNYEADGIEKIYMFNHQTGQIVGAVYSETLLFIVDEPGAYTIYAVTMDGERINLKEHVRFESILDHRSEGNSLPVKPL